MSRLSRLILPLLLVFTAPIYSLTRGDILSPVSGVWANKQPLVVTVPQGEDVYYSLTGSDPVQSGLAYDEPVILDETGDISLRLSAIDRAGKRTDVEVRYKVDIPKTSDIGDLSSLLDTPLVKYYPGKSIAIPRGYKAIVGGEDSTPVEGVLKLDPECSVARRVGMQLFPPSGAAYRVVLSVVPNTTTGVKKSTAQAPIEVVDWETIRFTLENTRYKVDGGDWGVPKGAMKLDRRLDHTIQYQRIDYSEGGDKVPIESYTLPQRPSVIQKALPGGGIEWVMEEDNAPSKGWTFGDRVVVVADAFGGERVVGSLPVTVLYEGLLQGTIILDYDVDKRAMSAPVFTPSAKGIFSREDVTVGITARGGGRIYYTVQDSIEDETPRIEDYKPLTGEIVLRGQKGIGVTYRLYSYSRGNSGGISDISTYTVTVDKVNYYLDPNAKGDALNDGSRDSPFTNISDALEVLGSIDIESKLVLHILGDITLGEEAIKYIIQRDMTLVGDGERTKLTMNGAAIVCKRAILTLTNLVIESSGTFPLVTVESGDLNILGCEVIGEHSASSMGAALINVRGGSVNIARSGLTIYAAGYGAVLSAVGTNVVVISSVLTSVSPTAVCLTLNGGRLDISQTRCSVQGNMGRVLELSGVTTSMEHNTFTLSIGDGEGETVYKDAFTKIVKDFANTKERH